jgi:hypothetical protein
MGVRENDRRAAVRYACLVICRVVLATPERVICAGILVAVLVKEPGEAAPMVPVPVTAGAHQAQIAARSCGPVSRRRLR